MKVFKVRTKDTGLMWPGSYTSLGHARSGVTHHWKRVKWYEKYRGMTLAAFKELYEIVETEVIETAGKVHPA